MKWISKIGKKLTSAGKVNQRRCGIGSWVIWLHKAERSLGMLMGAGGLVLIVSFLAILNSWDSLKSRCNQFLNQPLLAIVSTYLCKKKEKTTKPKPLNCCWGKKKEKAFQSAPLLQMLLLFWSSGLHDSFVLVSISF